MWSVPQFRTPQNFFRLIIIEAEEIRNGHLDELVRRRRARPFTLRDFRRDIEEQWENAVQIFARGQLPRNWCILEIRYCFTPDLYPTDCDEPNARWEDHRFELQTELFGNTSCPQPQFWDHV